MKKISVGAVVALYFVGVIALAVILSSCGTGHVSCDAYGNIDNVSIDEDKA